MANDDKLKNKIEEGAGRLKEALGRLTGDEQTRREGTVEKGKAQLKDNVQDAAEKIKDIFKK